jgi:predicted dehydrogenase
VIGIDVDARRIQLARENGLERAFDSTADDHIPEIVRLTGGAGADACIITAASSSDEIVSEAARCCRRKGRVVLVGDVGLKLRRNDFYAKELDFLISTSYGPGRYDPVYELGGEDYPLAYVRWTENRNMEAYLEMLANGQVRLNTLLGPTFDVQQAVAAYAHLQGGAGAGVLTLLSYPPSEQSASPTVSVRSQASGRTGAIGVALIGAGNFAQAMHLPNLSRLKDHFRIQAIVGRSGVTAKGAATRFGAAYATTDFEAVLQDPAVDVLIICTRHDLHTSMALRALRAGKHVLVEKPLAITEAQLSEIERHFEGLSGSSPLLMTGFNRRFSPAAQRAKELLSSRKDPLIANYRMNAGHIPLDHWVHSAEGGGRNIGEACHIYDLFNFLTGSSPVRVTAATIVTPSAYWARNDNFVATVQYADGSVCTLTYTALGHKSYPKERMEIFCGGAVIELDDYRALRVSGSRKAGWTSRTVEKGQLEELVAFAKGISQGSWPISYADQVHATRTSFEVERHVREG